MEEEEQDKLTLEENKLDDLDDLDSEGDDDEPEEVLEKIAEELNPQGFKESVQFEGLGFKLILHSTTQTLPELMSWLKGVQQYVLKKSNNKRSYIR